MPASLSLVYVLLLLFTIRRYSDQYVEFINENMQYSISTRSVIAIINSAYRTIFMNQSIHLKFSLVLLYERNFSGDGTRTE